MDAKRRADKAQSSRRDRSEAQERRSCLTAAWRGGSMPYSEESRAKVNGKKWCRYRPFSAPFVRPHAEGKEPVRIEAQLLTTQ